MIEKLKSIICNYTGDSTIVLNKETSLIGDLGLDSLDLVNLANIIEDEWNIEIKDRNIKDLKTISDIMILITQLS
ncbi:MAG: acyl carrier protein [Lachnospiraceae bacterium]|nr:acyl carrier protein [Lachnospiraceae bacterium]